ncbi:importin subunit alpha-4 [Anaeramoeba flamelloides]|uniref:Importin subunit alpha-4 n=1 Tax=Anaeramoeba flamelloides TaxID=1746091 RepID=A0ABQ8YRF1_9EUKA|nr:importin subunit alpha-4 [Anaeramoeba flamelloides]
MSSHFKLKQKQRTQSFKKTMTRERSVSKRRQFIIQLSKNKKEQNLYRRRQKLQNDFLKSQFENFENQNGNIPALIKLHYQKNDLVSVSNLIKQLEEKLGSVDEIREIAQQLEEENLYPYLISLIEKESNVVLCSNSLSILTSIGSTIPKMLPYFIAQGLLEKSIKVLKIAPLQINSIRCIGHIVSNLEDGNEFFLLKIIVQLFIEIFEETQKIKIKRETLWCFSCFLSRRPLPDFDDYKEFLPYVYKSIYEKDEEILIDTFNILASITTDKENIQTIIDSADISHSINLLSHKSHGVQSAVVKLIGNIVSGTDEQTDYVIKLSVLPGLVSLLSNEKSFLRRQACWVCSNILCQKVHIPTVSDYGIIKLLQDIIKNDFFDVKREAIFCFSKIFTLSEPGFILKITTKKLIKRLMQFFDIEDQQLIYLVLKIFRDYLVVGNDSYQINNLEENVSLTLLEENNVFKKIEKLISHKNQQICYLSRQIIDWVIENQIEIDMSEEMIEQPLSFDINTPLQIINTMNKK